MKVFSKNNIWYLKKIKLNQTEKFMIFNILKIKKL